LIDNFDLNKRDNKTIPKKFQKFSQSFFAQKIQNRPQIFKINFKKYDFVFFGKKIVNFGNFLGEKLLGKI